MKYKLILKYIGILFLTASLVSCAIFRKKNKCNDCPKWGGKKHMILLPISFH
ncbi:MAG: hypothetical protein HND27_02290 [Bacteroidetes bacterium]|nr:hypothetical protein [Flavobacteriales bacterium]NOG94588.1 hypothetical protein [Bacteroidota bacterium]WKZ75680.1 MAG: hypothetical protein QY303_02055 [Vicingaceae bacterium]